MNGKTKSEEWEELLLIMVTEEEKSSCRAGDQKGYDGTAYVKGKEEGKRNEEGSNGRRRSSSRNQELQ
jgi:hypothetical protein